MTADSPLRRRGGVLLLFALALGWRLAVLWQWHDTPFFTTPIGDGLRYQQWAQGIAAGDWFGREVFYQAPLYPYLLALLYSVFGDGAWVARLFQALLGALGCVLLRGFAARAFSPAAGWLCGYALAFYPPAVFNDGILQKTSLAAALLAACLYLFVRLLQAPRRPAIALLLGAALALLSLAQEQLLLLAPLFTLWLAWRGESPPGARLLAVLALLLGAALVFTPIGLRNQAIGGSFLITTSQFGPNFYLGNNPKADGHYHALREGRGDAEFERDDARALAEQAVGRRLGPAEVSDYWLQRSLAYIRAQPLDWFALSLHKLHLTWHARELPDTDSLYAYAEQSPLLAALMPFWHFGVLAPLALAGIALRQDAWRRDGWLTTAIAGLTLGVAAFIVYARYRFPLVLLLLPFAAHALVVAGGALAGRRPPGLPRTVAALLLLGATAVAVNWRLPQRDLLAVNYYGVAARLLDQHGDLAQAEALLERTIELVPQQAYPHFALSVVYKRRGDARAEAAELRRALSLAPQVQAGYAALADAERRAAEQARR